MADQWKAHCLLVAYPAQGHINPMLQFCKRLEYHKVKATLVTTRSFWRTVTTELTSDSNISIETISDGYDEGVEEEARKNSKIYVQRFWQVGFQSLSELIEKLSGKGCPVDCVIYDSFLHWAVDVAKKFGLVGAAFFTQTCAVNCIYFHLHQGILKLPITESKILFPGLTELEPSDLPTFLYLQYGMHPQYWDLLVDPFNNIGKADWVLSNSVYELEPEVVDWMKKMWPVRTIGPTVPSMFLDKRIPNDNDYGISMFKPSNDLCMNWLNDKPKASVVYVSFGSLASYSEEQMQELAWGLIDADSYFLWVVRESEEAKLPRNILETLSKKGLIVRWCPQLKVLAHEAVGCFITHCGWNSTLEALSLGVPMIGVPYWSDQTTNLKHIVDVWKVGHRAPVDEKGILKRETVKHCIKEVMESEKGKEMKNSAIKWMNLIKNSVDEGGSSDKNIAEFVARISQQ
ncbi:UDP-glycosyltransferase 74G1-like [Neltuma alba]|uniref:UDP-glycosyltransferase 74G1-like n=1 Tax=Neltuma alba TaxID=207710 RepID=UPI0010A56A57|nr:UDP-glycosyltransferase 74G1-like [Prosopis alba]